MIKFIKKIKDKIRKWNPKDGGTILLEQAIKEWELRNGNRKGSNDSNK